MALEPAENTLDMQSQPEMPAIFAVVFVADLHYADVHAGLFERGQSLLGVVVYGVGGFVRVAFKGFPRLGHLLLCWGRPRNRSNGSRPALSALLPWLSLAMVSARSALTLPPPYPWPSAVNGSFHTQTHYSSRRIP